MASKFNTQQKDDFTAKISRLFSRNVALLGLTTIILGSGTTGYTQPISKSLPVPTVTNRSAVERFNLDFYSGDFKNKGSIKITYDAGELFKKGIELEKSGNLQEANTYYQLALETAKKNGTNFRLQLDKIGKIFDSFSKITITYNTPSGSVRSLEITPPYFRNAQDSPSYKEASRPLIESIVGIGHNSIGSINYIIEPLYMNDINFDLILNNNPGNMGSIVDRLISQGILAQTEKLDEDIRFLYTPETLDVLYTLLDSPPYITKPWDVVTWMLNNNVVDQDAKDRLISFGWTEEEITQANEKLRIIHKIKEQLKGKFGQESDAILRRSLTGKGSYEDIKQIVEIAVKIGVFGPDSSQITDSQITEWLKKMGIGLDCSGFAAYVLNQLLPLPNPNPVWVVVVTESDIQEFITSYTNGIDVSKSIILELEFLQAFNPEMTSSGTFKERLNIDFANISSPLDLVPGTIMYQPGHVRIVESVRNTGDGIEFTTVEWRSNEQEPNKRRDWRYLENKFQKLQIKSEKGWSDLYDPKGKRLISGIVPSDPKQIEFLLYKPLNTFYNSNTKMILQSIGNYDIVAINPIPPSAGISQSMQDALLQQGWQQVADILSQDNNLMTNPIARLLMGHAELKLNKNNESLQYFRSTNNPSDLKQWTAWTERLKEQNPNSSVAFYLSGDAKIREGNLQPCSVQSSNNYLANSLILMANGKVQVKKPTQFFLSAKPCDHLEDALKDFNQAIALNPNFALAYNARGVIYALKQNWDNAHKDLAQAVSLEPKLADAYANLGTLSVRQGASIQRSKEALDYFKQAIALNPHFALAKLALDTVGGIDTRSLENVPIDRGNQPENISVARSDHRVQINRSDRLSKILFGLYYEVSPVQSNR